MITLNEISKTYKSKNGEFVYALKNISLAFPEHGMVFVTGKSGSGKSTLLNLITALDKADYGDIIINNQAIKDFTAKDCDDYRNTYLGIIFQEFNLLEQFVYMRI